MEANVEYRWCEKDHCKRRVDVCGVCSENCEFAGEKQSIEGDRAVEIFKLARQGGALPQKIDELVPLSFIGQAAVTFMRSKLKAMKDLKMTEEQRRATLKDGQEAGEMLLDIEMRIGELAEKVERAKQRPIYRDGALRGSKTTEPRKHERIGIPENRMKQAQQLAKHPEVVEKIKAEARASDDIPTKTAAIKEIAYQKEKARRKEAEEKNQKIRAVVKIEQVEYVNALDKVIAVLPTKPPKEWDEKMLKEARAKAKIIIKRLEVFLT